MDVFGSASLGNWTALCLISLTCSEILGWLLSAASHRLGAELRFLGSLGGIAGSASNPFYLILARKALPDLGVNVLHGSELWVSPQPSASGALQQLLCFQLPPPPVSARCVHPEEEFAATRHLSFSSVLLLLLPFELCQRELVQADLCVPQDEPGLKTWPRNQCPSLGQGGGFGTAAAKP